MSATTTTNSAASVTLTTAPRGRMALDGRPSNYGDFRDALNRDGYAVIKGAIPRERAEAYSNYKPPFRGILSNTDWTAGGLGYDRNDPLTVKKANLPVLNEKGMILSYGVSHEKWVWDIRGEPGVVEPFTKVYDDEDLIVSFDVVNVGFANRGDLPENKPWPHQDQDPAKPGFRCLQGLVNLNPCGPNDGGLIVCKGGHSLSEQFDKEMASEPRIPARTPEWFGFTDRGMQWLKDSRLQWEKVCADPGDLIICDSRIPHYNVPSTTKQDRFAVYTCFMPVADATQEDLMRKKDAFERRLGTTHWPNAQHVADSNSALRDGKVCPKSRDGPVEEPVLSERVFKLTGIPYIKSEA